MFQATQCFPGWSRESICLWLRCTTDDRHIKKRYIGHFATNLVNAVRGKITPTRAYRPRN